ncbi:MAG: M15 family peptidase [Nitriliruptorales bacterium]|nr:M15 family peptidase [Nitriliruptorales bacterium]
MLAAGCQSEQPARARDGKRPARPVAQEPPPAPATERETSEPPDAVAVPDDAEEPAPAESPLPEGLERPDWLATRVLPLRADGFGEIQPTPPELADRRLPPPDLLPPPEGDAFAATLEPVPDDVLARSTWSSECPVDVSDLRYLTVTFWGFDDRPHTGELLVHASVAEDLTTVFGRLYEARFPIEEMRVIARRELDAPPTGDGNNTTAFVCRPTTGGTRWSEHAYGLAADINPFHNPYVKGDLVVPELASAYLDRELERPGMIQAGDPVTEAFAAMGWGWGGAWRSVKDTMHFSHNGR